MTNLNGITNQQIISDTFIFIRQKINNLKIIINKSSEISDEKHYKENFLIIKKMCK